MKKIARVKIAQQIRLNPRNDFIKNRFTQTIIIN